MFNWISNFFGKTALNYNKVSEDYDISRPDYPDECINIILRNLREDRELVLKNLMEGYIDDNLNESKNKRRKFLEKEFYEKHIVLDLGAGTGKLIKILEQIFEKENIIAMEPSASMRNKFEENNEKIQLYAGLAESTRLNISSIDIVFVGTAFHWFDVKMTLNEIYRILRLNGQLVLIWNMLDAKIEWVANLRNLINEIASKYSDVPKSKSHDTMEWLEEFKQDKRFSIPIRETYTYIIRKPAKDLINCLLTFQAAASFTEEDKNLFSQLSMQKLNLIDLEELIDIPLRVETYVSHTKFIKKDKHSAPIESLKYPDQDSSLTFF